MKRFIFFFVIAAMCNAAFAQKGKNNESVVPKFGKIDKAELEMKECDFDNKAEALILVDEGDLDYIWGTGMELTRRLRIKILSEKGFKLADIHLKYRSEKNAEMISKLEASAYNLDEAGNIKETKVDKKLIYDKKLNKKYSEKVFTFPEVKVGTIIEYKFKESGLGLIDWYFQSSVPVKYTRFTFDLPEEIHVSAIPYCSHPYDMKEDNKNLRIAKTYTMKNLPALKDENYIMNEDYYRDRLETRIVSYKDNTGLMKNNVANWVQVIKYLMEDEDFGTQLKKNIPRTADLDQQLKNISSDYDKMKTIYKYVQENMKWNEYYGIWALDGVKSAWKDKKGTVGEINLILTNLLKDADLKAYPVLVSTHDNGIVNTADAGTYDFPGFYQFDKVMAYVEIDDNFYVLDASNKDNPVHLIPSDVLMTEGLLISKIDTYEWGWRSLWNNKATSKNIMLLNCKIDAGGKMTGEANINSYDYARMGRVSAARKNKDKYIETYFPKTSSGIAINEVVFENLESDSLPFVQKIKFDQQLSSSGDYSYFSSNILTGLEQNPFISESRFSDVFFGVKRNYTIIGNFSLPDGYEFEELPKNIKMIMPDTSITMSRMAQVSGNNLMTRLQLEFNKPFYPAAQYPEFQEFYKRLYDILNEQFVIKKKARP